MYDNNLSIINYYSYCQIKQQLNNKGIEAYVCNLN